MSLSDDLAAEVEEQGATQQIRNTPKDWNPQREDNGDGTGSIVTKPYPGNLDLPDDETLLRDHNLDPELYEIVGPRRVSQWPGGKGGTDVVAFRFSYAKKAVDGPSIDYPIFYARAREEITYKPTLAPVQDPYVAVVCTADWQIGKVDHRGGTEDTIRRIRRSQQMTRERLEADPPSAIVYADLGDIVEGHESSGGVSLSTNDRDHVAQLDIAATLTYDAISDLSQIAPTVATTTQSNHARLRKGNVRLGPPSADYGLHVFRQVERALPDVEFVFPEAYDEFVALSLFDDFSIGFTHGDQYGQQAKVKTWWASMSHGGTPLADCTLLVTGHYHNPSVVSCGRTRNGQARYSIGCATLDNGSSWARNAFLGADSDPGFAIIKVRESGFRLEDVSFIMMPDENPL